MPRVICPECGHEFSVYGDSPSASCPNCDTIIEFDDEYEGGGGGCFITTAAYGSPQATEVDFFRKWRDESLMKTNSGKTLINMYYTISPSIAHIISKSNSLRAITRIVLQPFFIHLKSKY